MSNYLDLKENPDLLAAIEAGERKALAEIAATQPEPRVFVIYYPPGSSRENPNGEMKDNANLANDVIKRLLKNVDEGKSTAVAFPIALPNYVTGEPVPQWRLTEVQRIDEEKHEQLEWIAEIAIRFCKLLQNRPLPLPVGVEAVLHDLVETLHDAGYEWEELT